MYEEEALQSSSSKESAASCKKGKWRGKKREREGPLIVYAPEPADKWQRAGGPRTISHKQTDEEEEKKQLRGRIGGRRPRLFSVSLR